MPVEIMTNAIKIPPAINNAFAAIDCELSELQNNVDSGQYSNQDIFDQIQEIRDKL